MKIEKNIPVPSRSNGKYSIITEMEIGDSFHVECAPLEVNSLRATIGGAARRAGIKAITRTDETGFRVWRVEES